MTNKRLSITRQVITKVITNLFLFCLYIVMISFLTSCGKKEVKPVSDESRLTQEAIKVAETLKAAYIKNDRRELEKNSTKDAYVELIGAIKSFEEAELTFTPTWVEIEDSKIYLTVSWKGTWKVKEQITDERGVAIFEFEGKPLKLIKVHRASPFIQPE